MRVQSLSTGGSRKTGGFTLIELMVVVAVVAILATIALPSYQESVRKGRRGQAKADLVEAAQIAERYRTVNHTYAGAIPGLPTQSPKIGTASYNIAIVNADSNSFTLSATPTGPQANDRCGVLTINQAGVKKHSIGTTEQCQFGTPN